ncbi:hypothetical protein [Nonomuraea maheshkhaliensis]|uniref:hypothetical protein n=1 Tax=Nonomuraea maheshkhaliensis TaxID=419590 RepID=UPI003D15B000
MPATTVFSQVSAGGSHTIALAKDGTVWAWGASYYGAFGQRHHRPEPRTGPGAGAVGCRRCRRLQARRDGVARRGLGGGLGARLQPVVRRGPDQCHVAGVVQDSRAAGDRRRAGQRRGAAGQRAGAGVGWQLVGKRGHRIARPSQPRSCAGHRSGQRLLRRFGADC